MRSEILGLVYKSEKYIGEVLQELGQARDKYYVTSKYGDANTSVKDAFHTSLKDVRSYFPCNLEDIEI